PRCLSILSCYYLFNNLAPTAIYTLSLHDALPISQRVFFIQVCVLKKKPNINPAYYKKYFCCNLASMLKVACGTSFNRSFSMSFRSEEHTSELQSRENLVCRLLLEKKKKRLESQAS